ncbi:hypothetical protein VPHF86_0308 [Vibrio phage F86]
MFPEHYFSRQLITDFRCESLGRVIRKRSEGVEFL